MTRHGSPYMTVAFMAHWPMTKHVPILELNRPQHALAPNSNATHGLTPHEITLIRPATALPQRRRLPSGIIPKPLYP